MLKYLKNVVTLSLDVTACNGCGMCAIVCPHGVFGIEDQKAVILERDSCIECGACANNCPVGAIKVQTGAGCATGVLLGAIGKGNECSSCCGVSPAGTEPSKMECCGIQTENSEDDSNTSCCCR
jgi:NAD-dependent dihydropyrimidine dehydrogenase PreA subunit